MSAGDAFVKLAHRDPTILICTDLQVQPLGEHRADSRAIIAHCAALLALWRQELWPVLHLKRIAQAPWFDPASGLTDWVAEFRPRPGEMVFEHPLPSAYSSSRFAEYMASMKSVDCLMTGCSLDQTILATAIEGFHRGHRYRVVADAVLHGHCPDEAGYLTAIVTAIGRFAGTERSSDLLIAAAGGDLTHARP